MDLTVTAHQKFVKNLQGAFIREYTVGVIIVHSYMILTLLTCCCSMMDEFSLLFLVVNNIVLCSVNS